MHIYPINQTSTAIISQYYLGSCKNTLVNKQF